jgi:hypothetical protein
MVAGDRPEVLQVAGEGRGDLRLPRKSPQRLEEGTDSKEATKKREKRGSPEKPLNEN